MLTDQVVPFIWEYHNYKTNLHFDTHPPAPQVNILLLSTFFSVIRIEIERNGHPKKSISHDENFTVGSLVLLIFLIKNLIWLTSICSQTIPTVSCKQVGSLNQFPLHSPRPHVLAIIHYNVIELG